MKRKIFRFKMDCWFKITTDKITSPLRTSNIKIYLAGSGYFQVFNNIASSQASSFKLFRCSCLEVCCKGGLLKNLEKFTGKYLCPSLFLINYFNFLIKLQVSAFFQNSSGRLFYQRLLYRCFPWNFVKFLTTQIFKEHLRWLLFAFKS